MDISPAIIALSPLAIVMSLAIVPEFTIGCAKLFTPAKELLLAKLGPPALGIAKFLNIT